VTLDEIDHAATELLVLEDQPEVRENVEQYLRHSGFNRCKLFPAQSSSFTAYLQESANRNPDLVLFGLHPESEGNWENLGRLRGTFPGPVLALTASYDEGDRKRALGMGVHDYVPLDECGEAGLELKIETVLAIHRVQSLIDDNDHRMQRLFVNILTVMVKILESKDPYTRFHSHSVAMWSRMLGRKKGLNEEELLRLGLAAVFHDFGKIGIPEDVLNKPMRLTDEEFAVMMQHPLIARDLLSSIDLLQDLLPAITHHHERWDGKGYPSGLKGEEIPLWGRIIGIADAYDTMASQRTYKEPLSQEQLIAEFKRCRGTQFDPQLVDLMLEILEQRKRNGEEFVSSTTPPTTAVRRASSRRPPGQPTSP